MYDLLIAESALKELRAIEPAQERRRVAMTMQRLTIDPDAPGIGDVVDAAGRISRIGVIGGVAFAYWPDHALQRVRILAVLGVAE